MTQQRRRYQLDLRRYYRIPSVRVSLGIVLSLFIIAFFLIFAIRPTFATIAKLYKEIEESQKTLTTLEAKVKSLIKANDLMTKITPLLEKIDAGIPTSEAGVQDLAASIEAMAAQAGVSVESVTVGESLLNSTIAKPYAADKKGEVIELPYTIRVSGTFHNCMQMLQNMFRIARIASIENVSISKEGTKKQVTTISTGMTITGQAYYVANKNLIEKAMPETKAK